MKTSVTIKLRNYKEETVIANYGRNLHDAYMSLRQLVFNQFLSYGYIPKDICYFIEYKENGSLKTLAIELDELQQYGRELSEKLNANQDLFSKRYLASII